jgi:hypothetical protein
MVKELGIQNVAMVHSIAVVMANQFLWGNVKFATELEG